MENPEKKEYLKGNLFKSLLQFCRNFEVFSSIEVVRYTSSLSPNAIVEEKSLEM